MTEAFLRRAPQSAARSTRTRVATRWVWVGACVAAFAVADARNASRMTHVTREIQESKNQITTLESELGYALRLEGAFEGREAALEALERESGFAAPDSGCVVHVRAEARHQR